MKRAIASLAALALLSLFSPGAGIAQSSEEYGALRKELDEIRRGQAAMHKELEAIRSLLQPRQPPAPVQPANLLFAIDSHPAKGDRRARLVLLEFTDYQCPFCARHATQTMPQIEAEYIQTGKLRYVLRDFPIESLHPQAARGHAAAHCAGEQGKYWEMHGRLFANQKAMSPAELSDHGQALGLDLTRFTQCLGGAAVAARIRGDIAEGQQAGVQGTPTFFLGWAEAGDGRMRAVQSIRGAQPYAVFKGAVEARLAEPR